MSYRRRTLARKYQSAEKRRKEREFHLIAMDKICRQYEAAFFDAYDLKPKATYNRGWFCVGKARFRYDDFVARIKFLEVKAHALKRHEVAVDSQDD